MKWLIEETDNLVKAKQITKNEEEYGDSLVELTDEELDQRLKEYSAQGKYIAMYYQMQTQRHGIEFNRFYYGAKVVKDKLVLPEYNWLPKEMADNEYHSGEKTYYIRATLLGTEISKNGELAPFGKYYYLTEEELADKVKEYLKQGKQVRFGKYELRKKQVKFITDRVVKEANDNGEIIYYKKDMIYELESELFEKADKKQIEQYKQDRKQVAINKIKVNASKLSLEEVESATEQNLIMPTYLVLEQQHYKQVGEVEKRIKIAKDIIRTNADNLRLEEIEKLANTEEQHLMIPLYDFLKNQYIYLRNIILGELKEQKYIELLEIGKEREFVYMKPFTDIYLKPFVADNGIIEFKKILVIQQEALENVIKETNNWLNIKIK